MKILRAALPEYRGPFCASFELHFQGDAVAFDRGMNVGFGPTGRPALAGRRGETAAGPSTLR